VRNDWFVRQFPLKMLHPRNSPNRKTQIQIKPRSKFEFVPIDTEESKFVDLVGFGGVSSWVETVIHVCSLVCDSNYWSWMSLCWCPCLFMHIYVRKRLRACPCVKIDTHTFEFCWRESNQSVCIYTPRHTLSHSHTYATCVHPPFTSHISTSIYMFQDTRTKIVQELSLDNEEAVYQEVFPPKIPPQKNLWYLCCKEPSSHQLGGSYVLTPRIVSG